MNLLYKLFLFCFSRDLGHSVGKKRMCVFTGRANVHLLIVNV